MPFVVNKNQLYIIMRRVDDGVSVLSFADKGELRCLLASSQTTYIIVWGSMALMKACAHVLGVRFSY